MMILKMVQIGLHPYTSLLSVKQSAIWYVASNICILFFHRVQLFISLPSTGKSLLDTMAIISDSRGQD